ncbi:MAG: hypothetical protein OHK0048_01240 [Rhodoferax sp.]
MLPKKTSRRLIAATLTLAFCPALWAHAIRHGALEIEHPYALPNVAGSTDGYAYLRAIRNRGHDADRLVAATTPRAESVVVRRQSGAAGQGGSAGVSIEIPGGRRLSLGHTGPYRLHLMGLREPLRDGDRFALTLQFEHAGPVTVQVWVQAPRPATGQRP